MANKPNPDFAPTHERHPLLRGRKAAVALAFTAMLAGGCSNQGNASPAPSPEPTPTTKTETPLPTETRAEYVMTSKLDYALFDNWETLTKEEQLARCDALFANNGIEAIPNDEVNIDFTPEQIVSYWDSRYAIVTDIARDQSNAQNLGVAHDVLGCITSPHFSGNDVDANTSLGNGLDLFKYEPDLSPNYMGLDLGPVTRHTSTVWTNRDGWNSFVIEQSASDKFSKTFEQRVFEMSKDGNRIYLAGIYVGDGGDVMFGSTLTAPPVIVDPARANAPYQLEK